jgi:hypothetical protein
MTVIVHRTRRVRIPLIRRNILELAHPENKERRTTALLSKLYRPKAAKQPIFSLLPPISRLRSKPNDRMMGTFIQRYIFLSRREE